MRCAYDDCELRSFIHLATQTRKKLGNEMRLRKCDNYYNLKLQRLICWCTLYTIGSSIRVCSVYVKSWNNKSWITIIIPNNMLSLSNNNIITVIVASARRGRPSVWGKTRYAGIPRVYYIIILYKILFILGYII